METDKTDKTDKSTKSTKSTVQSSNKCITSCEIINELEPLIDADLKHFKINKDTLNKMEEIYLTNDKYHRNILKLVVKDNKIEFIRDVSIIDKETNERMDLMIKLIKKAQEFMDSKNNKLSDCTIYLYVSNVYAYEYQDLPFFVLARPNNRTGILFPDETFIFHKIKDIELNWDEIKEVIMSHCGMEKYDKINKLYFRGSNAGGDKHNLRKLLEKERKYNNFYDITIGSYNIPLYGFCKYKYLLNLPANQPWSARFKYLLLMKSLMIHVDIRQHYEFSENEPWITLFGQLFKDKREFVNLVYDWYNNDEVKNKQNLNKLVGEIKDAYVYYEDNPDVYDELVKNAFRKINIITLEVVYETIYLIINKYADNFN